VLAELHGAPADFVRKPAIRPQHWKVQVHPQRRVETLHERHRTRYGSGEAMLIG